MDLPLTLLTLTHILVLVYWLGGDLGAFYASTILTDAKQPAAARVAAARVLNTVDMAPRTASILAFPTGLSLAAAKGWVSIAPAAALAVWALFGAWLALAWVIHLRHLAPSSLWRRVDLGVRWVVLALLIALAAGVLIPALPAFLRLKIAILALAIIAGLAIRQALAPFGLAFAAMASGAGTAETDAVIARALNRARPIVLLLWALLLVAAVLGVAGAPV